MNRGYLSSKNLRKYYSELTWHCPNVTRETRGERERIKNELKAQLSGEVRVNLIKIQVNNVQIYEKTSTSTKGSSVEKEVLGEDPQNDVSKSEDKEEEEEEEEIINVLDAAEPANIVISHAETLLQQQGEENRYELEVTGSIDTQFTTTMTTTKTAASPNLNINIELTQHNNNNNTNDNKNEQIEELIVEEKEQNVESLSEVSVEPGKIPTKVLVLSIPRAFTSCSFQNPISFELSKPEEIVKVIAPQVRELLANRKYDETFQATKVLEQINDENGMLLDAAPSTSKIARKRGRPRNTVAGQPLAKKKAEPTQESEHKSLLQFYESAGFIIDEQDAMPRPCNNENINLDSTVVKVSRNKAAFSKKACFIRILRWFIETYNKTFS